MAQPDLIPAPFAENATPGAIEPIPPLTPSVPQQATWSSGFPQVTMQPLAAGGIPPRGQDFNGVLNALSQHIFHMQGGGQYKWSDDHGPYSIGDVLQSDDGLRAYVSVVDNNTDNFNTHPASIGVSWLPWSGGAASELVAGLIQIATSAETQTGTNATKAVTPSALSSRTSTESRTGLIQLATTAEAQALTNDTKALTPKKLGDAIQPTVAGSITLNGTTNNTVVMTDIVTELGLEIGDVIRIDTGAYNKLHTVETITDNSSISVNSEHSGNMGNGSLKLPDFTGQATVTRIAKRFNAPLGMGKAPVNVTHIRTHGVTYTSPYFPITVSISTVGVDPAELPLLSEIINGVSYIFGRASKSGTSSVFGVISSGSEYRADSSASSGRVWIEVR